MTYVYVVVQIAYAPFLSPKMKGGVSMLLLIRLITDSSFHWMNEVKALQLLNVNNKGTSHSLCYRYDGDRKEEWSDQTQRGFDPSHLTHRAQFALFLLGKISQTSTSYKVSFVTTHILCVNFTNKTYTYPNTPSHSHLTVKLSNQTKARQGVSATQPSDKFIQTV